MTHSKIYSDTIADYGVPPTPDGVAEFEAQVQRWSARGLSWEIASQVWAAAAGAAGAWYPDVFGQLAAACLFARRYPDGPLAPFISDLHRATLAAIDAVNPDGYPTCRAPTVSGVDYLGFASLGKTEVVWYTSVETRLAYDLDGTWSVTIDPPHATRQAAAAAALVRARS